MIINVNPKINDFFILKNNKIGKVVSRNRTNFKMIIDQKEYNYAYSNGAMLHKLVDNELYAIRDYISQDTHPEYFL